jgi:succinate dehydrogenase/fumarate reductase-like Fe-S protein
MVYNCTNLPFSDLGFVPYDENMWIRFSTNMTSIPEFAITTTINPVSQTFVIKHLITNKMMSTNSYDAVKEFVITNDRDEKLKKILD